MVLGDLKTVTATMPGVKVNPRNGRSIFFNSIIGATLGWQDSRNTGKAVAFADGTYVPVIICVSECHRRMREY